MDLIPSFSSDRGSISYLTKVARMRNDERMIKTKGIKTGGRSQTIRHANLFKYNRSGERPRRTPQLVGEVLRCFTIKVRNDTCTKELFRLDSVVVVVFAPLLGVGRLLESRFDDSQARFRRPRSEHRISIPIIPIGSRVTSRLRSARTVRRFRRIEAGNLHATYQRPFP